MNGRRVAPAQRRVRANAVRSISDRLTRGTSAAEQRRASIAYEILRGVTDVHDLADRYGVSASTIKIDIKEIEERWKDQQLKTAEEVRARELRRLEKVMAEAWSGWDKSREDAVETRTSMTEDGEETTVSVRGQAGDPRFLETIRNTIADMLDVRGLRVQKVAQTDPSGQESIMASVFQEIRRLAEQVGCGVEVVDDDFIERHLAIEGKVVSQAAVPEGDESSNVLTDEEIDGSVAEPSS